MNLSEAAGLLLLTRERTKAAIVDGVVPGGQTQPIGLKAAAVGNDFEISEQDLDAFIAALEAAEPGRNPPIAVRRQLLCEARERCCICGEPGPLQFHHLIDWAKAPHHDPQHMMVLCSNCHGKCTVGQIEFTRQRFYKTNPYAQKGPFSSLSPELTITWADLRAVVARLHSELRASPRPDDSRYDFSYLEMEQKNRLNRLSDDSFAVWRREYEPKFAVIERFLADDHNGDIQELYFEIVGDLRAEIAVLQSRQPEVAFDEVIRQVFKAAFSALADDTAVSRETLRAVVAFMYFECDIGRK